MKKLGLSHDSMVCELHDRCLSKDVHAPDVTANNHEVDGRHYSTTALL